MILINIIEILPQLWFYLETIMVVNLCPSGNLIGHELVSNLEMSNFFDEQGRTRIYDEAY